MHALPAPTPRPRSFLCQTGGLIHTSPRLACSLLESCDRSSEGSPPEQRAPPGWSSGLLPPSPESATHQPPRPNGGSGLWPLPSQPAPPRTYRYLAQEPADTSSSGWRGAGECHGCAFGSRLCITCGRPGVGGRAVWAGGGGRPRKKGRESGEGCRAVRWQRAVSDFWRRPVRGSQEAGASGGRWGRSREVPGGHAVLLSGRSSRLDPGDSSPSPSPNLKVLQVRRAAPCSLLQPAVQGTPLTIPKAPPTHTLLGSGNPLEGSTQGRGK